MGNFDDAVRARPPAKVECPHCTNDDPRQLEFQGGVWICGCCSKTFRPDQVPAWSTTF